jgi:hypothetical protein
MNTVVMMSLLFTGILAHAGGIRCQSECIAVDFYADEVVVLGKAEVAADRSESKVFQALRGRCAQIANRAGYYRWEPMLAIDLKISSNSKETNESSRSYDSRYRRFRVRSSYSHRSERELNVEFRLPSQAESCTFDDEIPAWTPLPYLGDTPYLS